MMVHIHRLTVRLLTHVRRSRGPRVSRVEPRSGDAVAHPRERGERTGERTFRGAIWARDHFRCSPLAPWPSHARRSSARVVRAFRRRDRGERGCFRVISSGRPGTLASAP